MRERSHEELQGILQAFPDVFEAQMGTKLTIEKLKAVLTEKLKEKEQFLLDQRFADFSPASLRALLQILTEMEKPENYQVVETKKRGRPKRD